MKKFTLEHKIIIGYVILLAVIGSIMAILVYEHKRIKNVEIKSREIRQIQQVVYKIHRNLMELTMSGESAMG